MTSQGVCLHDPNQYPHLRQRVAAPAGNCFLKLACDTFQIYYGQWFWNNLTDSLLYRQHSDDPYRLTCGLRPSNPPISIDTVGCRIDFDNTFSCPPRLSADSSSGGISMLMMVLDSLNLELWETQDTVYQHFLCQQRDQHFHLLVKSLMRIDTLQDTTISFLEQDTSVCWPRPHWPPF